MTTHARAHIYINSGKYKFLETLDFVSETNQIMPSIYMQKSNRTQHQAYSRSSVPNLGINLSLICIILEEMMPIELKWKVEERIAITVLYRYCNWQQLSEIGKYSFQLFWSIISLVMYICSFIRYHFQGNTLQYTVI